MTGSADRAALPDITYDAVVVVPGIMGSALADNATGDTLWGFSQMLRYSRFWGNAKAFERLVPTAAERAGRETTVVPTGVLRFPAVAPLIRGIEPYSDLIAMVKKAVAEDEAVLEFAYDWRLAVEHNARCLARAARKHLDRWRAHPAHRSAPTKRQPRLVIVAHSMGGLVARSLYLVEGTDGVPDVTSDIRTIVTLGTPFLGSVRAALLLETGGGGPPLTHKGRMRRLAVTLPGVYDLLPMDRCVREAEELHRFTTQDVAAIGGDEGLAEDAIAFNERLGQVAMVDHRAMVGTGQRTLQSLHFDNGKIVPSRDDFEWDEDDPARDGDKKLVPRAADGDGTVARRSAMLEPPGRLYLAQQHGALARSPEGINFAADVVRERQYGSRQGESDLGIEAPDVVLPHQEWRIDITGATAIGAVTCDVLDAQSDKLVNVARLEHQDEGIAGFTSVQSPGVYRVRATGGGSSSVTQLVLAATPDA